MPFTWTRLESIFNFNTSRSVHAGCSYYYCRITIFVAFGIRYAYGILLPEMISSLAISNIEAGFIYSSYFLIYTLSSPVLGLMVDCSKARILLTVFVTLLVIPTILFGKGYGTIWPSMRLLPWICFQRNIPEASSVYGLYITG